MSIKQGGKKTEGIFIHTLKCVNVTQDLPNGNYSFRINKCFYFSQRQPSRKNGVNLITSLPTKLMWKIWIAAKTTRYIKQNKPWITNCRPVYLLCKIELILNSAKFHAMQTQFNGNTPTCNPHSTFTVFRSTHYNIIVTEGLKKKSLFFSSFKCTRWQ